MARSIRIVLLPDLRDGGDVSDWLDADPSRADQLVDVCLQAPIWTPEPELPSLHVLLQPATARRESERASALIMGSP